MTKHDIVERIYGKYQGTLTRNHVKDIVSFVFDEIVREMTEGGEAKISRFGTFKVAERNAKKARNPRTGEEVMIEDRKVPKFKPSRYLQNKVNNLPTDDEKDEDD
ncbi:HU family DNA-binding protein [Undibacterium sp. TS12]|uniref:HU family DNA-binding protein n=1 Tax=Undibacterium sp. TS12 TaxID=2908202 RepID=UPI001F4D152E|nr:HU family DNA-binding protein [Undibacterium sp. TS12]MCH8621315.1 HU family DNA-binding protein [Undibacterium sp. TS12]